MRNRFNIGSLIVLVITCHLFLNLSSCQVEDNRSNDIRVENTDGTYEEPVIDQSKVKHEFDVKYRYEDFINGSGYGLTEIEHDGCRYLVMEGYGETLSMMHKPNCMNEFHQKNKPLN